jgi:TIR domain
VPRLPGPVFLSHSYRDKPFVLKLRDELEALGFSTWVDAHDLHGGDSLPRTIADGIARSSAMVVVLSEAALTSKWLAYELQIAVVRMVEGQLAVIPAILEPLTRPVEISALLYADFDRRPYDEALKTIVTALEQREPEDVWVARELEDALDEIFDGRGFFSTPGEYRSEDFEFVDVDMPGEGGNPVSVIYEIERAYGDTPRPLSQRYWQEYLEAIDNVPEPYSLLITERPVEFALRALDGTDGRLRVYEQPGPSSLVRKYLHTAFVVDVSGDLDSPAQRRMLETVRDLVIQREAEYQRAMRARRAQRPGPQAG